MKQRLIKLALGCLIALSVISCASAPTTKAGELPDYLIKARTAAENSRAKAADIKAAVAAKTVFDQAETGFNAAKKLEAATDYENAAAGYNGAAELYAKAYEEASAKKEAALKAMNTAEAERKTSEDVILQATAEQTTAETGKGE